MITSGKFRVQIDLYIATYEQLRACIDGYAKLSWYNFWARTRYKITIEFLENELKTYAKEIKYKNVLPPPSAVVENPIRTDLNKNTISIDFPERETKLAFKYTEDQFLIFCQNINPSLHPTYTYHVFLQLLKSALIYPQLSIMDIISIVNSTNGIPTVYHFKDYVDSVLLTHNK